MPQATTHPTAVITGASAGIGKVAATALAQQGWTVIAIGRNAERCQTAAVDIQAKAKDSERVHMLCADLALMAEVMRIAKAIKSLTPQVQVLMNNAGGVAREKRITPEGNENTFAGNHLGHFLLTRELYPLLTANAASTEKGATRVISTSSTGHEQCDGLDWDDLQSTREFVTGTAYCRVKLANILFTRELAKRAAEDGIVAHVMHPGVVVGSNFINHAHDDMQAYMRSIEDVSLTVEEGADTLIWLATAAEPGQATGQYFHQRDVISASQAAQDDAAAKRLWQESEKLIEQSLASKDQ